MSKSQHPSRQLDGVMQPFVEFWKDYVQQADETTRKVLEAVDGTGDPQQWRNRWLAAMSKGMDAYLRSPAFLEASKHNMEMTLKAKRQADELARETARALGVPTANDISGLFERLHSVEEAILSRLGQIEGRLEAIEASLQPQPTAKASGGAAARSRRSDKPGPSA